MSLAFKKNITKARRVIQDLRDDKKEAEVSMTDALKKAFDAVKKSAELNENLQKTLARSYVDGAEVAQVWKTWQEEAEVLRDAHVAIVMKVLNKEKKKWLKCVGVLHEKMPLPKKMEEWVLEGFLEGLAPEHFKKIPFSVTCQVKGRKWIQHVFNEWARDHADQVIQAWLKKNKSAETLMQKAPKGVGLKSLEDKMRHTVQSEGVEVLQAWESVAHRFSKYEFKDLAGTHRVFPLNWYQAYAEIHRRECLKATPKNAKTKKVAFAWKPTSDEKEVFKKLMALMGHAQSTALSHFKTSPGVDEFARAINGWRTFKELAKCAGLGKWEEGASLAGQGIDDPYYKSAIKMLMADFNRLK